MHSKIDAPSVYEDRQLQPSVYGLSCFVAAKYIASGFFNPLNREVFCAYFYLYSHYDFLQFAENSIYLVRQPFAVPQIEEYVLGGKLGLKLVAVPVRGERLWEPVQEALDRSWPVIVPVNSNELPFKIRFPEQPAYPLLLTGYDAPSRAFVLYDHEQNHSDAYTVSDGMCYKEHLIPEEIVKRAFFAFGYHYQFERGHLYVLQPEGRRPLVNAKAVIDDLRQTVVSTRLTCQELLARKLACLQQLCHSAIEAERDLALQNELRYINSQRMIGEMIVRLCKEECYRQYIIDRIRSTNIVALQSWKKLLMVISLADANTRDNTKLVEKPYSSVILAERAFLDSIGLL